MISEMKKAFKEKQQKQIDQIYYDSAIEWIRQYISNAYWFYFEKKILIRAVEYNQKDKVKSKYKDEYLRVKNDYLWLHTPEEINRFIVCVLDYLHRVWILNNFDKFFKRNKKYEFMPSELIWWNRFKFYIRYLNPYLKHFNIRYTINWVRKEYNNWIYRFFEKRSITTEDSLVFAITTWKYFLKERWESPELLKFLKNEEKVIQEIIPSIKKQWTNITRWMNKVKKDEEMDRNITL